MVHAGVRAFWRMQLMKIPASWCKLMWVVSCCFPISNGEVGQVGVSVIHTKIGTSEIAILWPWATVNRLPQHLPMTCSLADWNTETHYHWIKYLSTQLDTMILKVMEATTLSVWKFCPLHPSEQSNLNGFLVGRNNYEEDIWSSNIPGKSWKRHTSGSGSPQNSRPPKTLKRHPSKPWRRHHPPAQYKLLLRHPWNRQT